MSLVLITGSSGLVGSESVDFFCQKGFDVVGVDNDLRKHFFGKKASTKWQTKKSHTLGKGRASFLTGHQLERVILTRGFTQLLPHVVTPRQLEGTFLRFCRSGI